MRRIHWWLLGGVPAASLLAALLGQTVLGQPDIKLPGLPTVPIIVQPELPGVKPDVPTPSLPSLPPAPAPQPLVPPVTPQPFKIDPSKIDNAPALPIEKFERPTVTKEVVSLNVAPGKQQPALAVEWNAPAAVRVNHALTAQIHVKNISATTAQNVVVRYRLSQGVTCKSTEPVAVNEGGELVWHLGTLTAEQSRRIELHLLPQTRGPLDCQAIATFTAVIGHQVQVREPQLLVKMRAPERIVVGENVSLLYAISNPGDGMSEAVKLKTVLPDGLEHPRGKIIEFEVGNLGPKEIKTMQLVCVAKGHGPQKCLVAATGDGGLNANDQCQFEILVPKLDVALSGPKLRYLDRHAVYTLKVTNPGSAPATNIEVQEHIPSGFKFYQANHGGQYAQATRLVSWNLGDLQPGQTKEIAVDLVPIEIGEHRLTAHAKGRGLKSEAEVRTVVEGLPSIGIEVAPVEDPIEVGAETTFQVRIHNAGTKMENNVQIVCTLPEHLEFKGAKSSSVLQCRLEGRDLVFDPLPRLAPKADVIYSVKVRGALPGDVRFRMKIRADSLKEPVLREQSLRIYSDDGVNTPAAPPVSVPPAPIKTPPVSAPPVPPAPVSVPVTKPVPTPIGLPPSPPISAPVAPAPINVPAPSVTPPVLEPIGLPPVAPTPLPPLPAPVPTPKVVPAPVPPVNVPAPTERVPDVSSPVPLLPAAPDLPVLPTPQS